MADDFFASKEPVTFVCMQVASMLEPVAGASIVTCEHCHADVWLAPSSVDIVAKLVTDGIESHIWCMPCVAESTGFEADQVVGVTPTQLAEIEAALERHDR